MSFWSDIYACSMASTGEPGTTTQIIEGGIELNIDDDLVLSLTAELQITLDDEAVILALDEPSIQLADDDPSISINVEDDISVNH